MELLTALVGFDTTSAKSNLELIGFVESVLRGHGLAATRVASPDGTKADLFATIGGEGALGFPAIATACRSRARAGPAIPSR